MILVTYGKVLGLLHQQRKNVKSINFLENFLGCFRAIYVSDKPISKLILSDDCQFLVILKHHENDILVGIKIQIFDLSHYSTNIFDFSSSLFSFNFSF